MTPSSWFTLCSLAFIFLGERTFGTNTPVRVVFDALAAILLVFALVDRLRRMKSASNDTRDAHRKALVLLLVTLGGLAVYALTLDPFVNLLALSEELAKKWAVILGAMWPLLILSGLIPMILVDRAISASPVRPHPLRVQDAIEGGLTVIFALGMLLPLNYLAKDLNRRWDMAYFRTTAPGDSTRSIVETMSSPVQAVLFFDSASEVEREVRPYFEALGAINPLFSVTASDNALEPELAKQYKIRDNGNIAIVMGDKSEVVKIGTDFDKARKTLKKLDSEVQKALVKVTKGERIAYFTVGHGEMSWSGQGGEDRKLQNLKKLLEAVNFKVKELGMGQGLANEVPDDATLVAIVGPDSNFLPEERASLERYIARGGRLLIALDPVQDETFDPDPLLQKLGLRYHRELVVTDEEKSFLPLKGGISDRQNIGTNRYSSHESVTTLSRNSSQAVVLLPGAGWIEETKDQPGKVTVVVRSLAKCWVDKDGDFQFNKESESRKSWDLAAAVSGPAESGPEYRAFVIGDASYLSDPYLPYKPNAILAADSLHWLAGEEDIAGTTNNEEDVKIVHSKEKQRIWFYGSTFLAPLALAGLGLLRVLLRKQKGVA